MAVPITKLSYHRVLDQIMNNLIGLQRDMAKNAASYKAMAEAQSPPIDVLAGFINTGAAKYLERIQWGKDIADTPAKETNLSQALNRVGLSMSDLMDISEVLESESITLQKASKNTYEEIAKACDRVIKNVELPPSLWPE